MTEKLIIQLLEEVHGEEDQQVRRDFRWGFIDEMSDWPTDSHVGSDEDLLANLSVQSQPALLMIPGHKVVTMPVVYNKKEARHFRKLLPYQIEDEVLGPVENLHFALGPVDGERISAAYIDDQWLESLLNWFKINNIVIEQCLADFQIMQSVDNELLIWFTQGNVWGHRSNGLGFSVAEPLSQAVLQDLLLNQQDLADPWDVKVYVDDAETQEIIESHILPAVEYQVFIGQPPLDFSQQNQLNFCNTKYSRQLPFDKWWQEAKSLVYLAAAALAVFFIASFADIYLIKKQQNAYQQEILSSYRTVVPRGPASDPVRRLRGLLSDGQDSAESSNSVYLLSKVAPVLDQLEIGLLTLNYSNREQAVRMSITAKTFNGIEQLRQQLDREGVVAELQSSNAADEGFQARMRLAIKGGRNG
ncbi:MAG: type II secretion system protein GspL [Pseudomonadota bacterium]